MQTAYCVPGRGDDALTSMTSAAVRMLQTDATIGRGWRAELTRSIRYASTRVTRPPRSSANWGKERVMWHERAPSARRAGVLTGAILTFVFVGLAALISNVFESATTIVVSNVVALLGVGWLTLQLRHGAHVIEPALGAAGAVLSFGAIQSALVPGFRQELGWNVVVTSIVVSTGAAFSLALIGALLASGRSKRASLAGAIREKTVEKNERRTAARHGFEPPESRPAPQSG
jgi:hypothetical protein